MKFIWCCYKAKRFTSKLLNQSITMWNGSVYKAQFLCLLFIESKSRLPIPEFSAYHCINVRKALLYRCNIFGFHFLRIYSDCTLEILSRLWIHFTYDRFHFSFISNRSKKMLKKESQVSHTLPWQYPNSEQHSAHLWTKPNQIDGSWYF